MSGKKPKFSKSHKSSHLTGTNEFLEFNIWISIKSLFIGQFSFVSNIHKLHRR